MTEGSPFFQTEHKTAIRSQRHFFSRLKQNPARSFAPPERVRNYVKPGSTNEYNRSLDAVDQFHEKNIHPGIFRHINRLGGHKALRTYLE